MASLADFANLLRQAMGLSVATVGMSQIHSAVNQRLAACQIKELDDYWRRVQAGNGELQQLIEAVVVPETWFFREPQAFAALAHEACSRCLVQRPSAPLRLLSVPCASGEEPYSIVMALLSAGVPADLFGVDAVDISASLLARAEAAVYGTNSFRGGQGVEFRDRYFEAQGDHFRLALPVRQRVTFHQGNLVGTGFLEDQAPYDFIFCRNLLIYFDQATKQCAVQRLTRLLKSDGLLFVGPAESGEMLNRDFVSIHHALSFGFRSKAAATPIHATGATVRNRAAPTLRRVAKAAKHIAKAKVPMQAAAQLAHQDPGKVLTPIDLDLVVLLANQGRWGEALRRGEELLASRMPTAQGHHLVALAHDAQGNPQQAEQHYRKALYLEPDHIESLDHLALLLQHRGDTAGASLLQRRARRCASTKQA